MNSVMKKTLSAILLVWITFFVMGYNEYSNMNAYRYRECERMETYLNKIRMHLKSPDTPDYIREQIILDTEPFALKVFKRSMNILPFFSEGIRYDDNFHRIISLNVTRIKLNDINLPIIKSMTDGLEWKIEKRPSVIPDDEGFLIISTQPLYLRPADTNNNVQTGTK